MSHMQDNERAGEPVYKADAQISTGQFEYIKIEVEDTVEGIIGAYRALKEGYAGRPGLPARDFQAFIIRQLLGEDGNHLEEYNRMSPAQQMVIQENKKALKTIKRHNEN